MKKTFTEAQIFQLTRQEEAIVKSQQAYLKDLQRVLKDVILGIQGLEEIEKKPSKVMVKLGPGILVEAEIKDTKNCMQAFADNGYQKATIKETVKWLGKKQKNVEKQIKKVSSDLAQSRQKLNELAGVIQQIEIEKSKNISVK
jgi:prefoldin subunit 5